MFKKSTVKTGSEALIPIDRIYLIVEFVKCRTDFNKNRSVKAFGLPVNPGTNSCNKVKVGVFSIQIIVTIGYPSANTEIDKVSGEFILAEQTNEKRIVAVASIKMNRPANESKNR